MITPTSQESEFIAASRLLMIGGLVFHHLFEIPGSSHSPRLNMESANFFVPEFVNSFFHMAFMTAVPLLGTISGYLFFRRPKISFKKLLRGRLFSIAIPTWLWSLMWLAFAYVLYRIGGQNEWLRWTDYGFAQPDIMTLINGVFGITREPFAFQFWFVHDLLLTLAVSPVIYLFLLWLSWRFVIIMALLWITFPYPPGFFSGNVVMFFTVGAWLALPNSPQIVPILERLRRYRWPLLLLFSSVLALRLMSYKFTGINDVLQGYVFLSALRVIGVLTTSALIFHLVLKSAALKQFLLRYSPYSFFIFAVHFPLIELLQIAALSIPGHNSAFGLFLSWLFIPIMTIAIIIMLAIQCRKYTPAAFHLLNGGRHAQTAIATASIESSATNNSSAKATN